MTLMKIPTPTLAGNIKSRQDRISSQQYKGATFRKINAQREVRIYYSYLHIYTPWRYISYRCVELDIEIYRNIHVDILSLNIVTTFCSIEI